MKARRYSSPPSEAKLADSTSRLTASLDVLEERVGSEPMPVGVAVAAQDLTDEQRLAVIRELWLFMRDRRFIHMDQAAHAYEREVRERLGSR